MLKKKVKQEVDLSVRGGGDAASADIRQRVDWLLDRRWPRWLTSGNLSRRVRENLVPLVLLTMVVASLGAAIDDFFSSGNILPALRQFGETGFVALGMLIVVIVGGIDLSVGGIFALCNFMALLLVQFLEWPVGVAIPVVLLAGGLLGLFNGFLIGYMRLRAFLTTLISIVIFRAIYDGLTAAYAGPITAKFPESEAWNYIAFGEILGVGIPFWLCIAFAIATHFVLTRLRPGLRIYAIGGSRRAAHNAGIPVARTVMLCYAASGVLTAISSIFFAARLGDLGSGVGVGLEVRVLTGIIAGGILLGGGKGSVSRAMVGLLIVLLLVNGLTEMSLEGGMISLALAAMLIVASVFERIIGANQGNIVGRPAPSHARLAPLPATHWPMNAMAEPASGPIIEVRAATKVYGGTPAVNNIDFTLFPGQVYGLLGENGAGKSTFAKSLAGVISLTSGEIRIEGRPVQLETPKQALEMGIAMVFQETSMVPTSTVAHNLFMGQERFYNGPREVNLAAQRVLQSLNFNIDPSAIVGNLGAAQKQMVEIARAVLHRARVIIFDEPTTSLTFEEKHSFFNLVRKLKAQGVAVVFITHAIEDALGHCDRITILRDGKHVLTEDAARLDIRTVVKAMVGRDLSQTMYGHKKATWRQPGQRVLAVHNLSMAHTAAAPVSNNTFIVSAGQVTGVFGLVGAGRTETFKIVAGLLQSSGGEILLDGKPRNYASPVKAVRDGIAYITEDRKVEGFFETMTASRNIYMGLLAKLGRSRNWLSRREEAGLGAEWMRRLSVRSATKNANVVELSGGNQQKVVIARSLVQDPRLVIFDEPTKGVDVGAIAEIHALISQLADEGKAVVVISSYLPELLTLSDRVLVARSGKIVEELSGPDATEENIMYAAVH